jgi:hypothetical protein
MYHSIDVQIYGPGPQMNFIPGAWLNFLIHFRYAHARFQLYPVCYPGKSNLTSSCHRDSKTANFSFPVCSPTGEAGKNVQTGFFLVICGLSQAFFRDLRSATIIYSGVQRIKFLFI